MTNPTDLADQVEKLAGPCREVDAAIHLVKTTFPARRAGVGWPDENALIVPVFPGWVLLPSYTASFDAAKTLVPEGMMYEFGAYSDIDGFTAGNFARVSDYCGGDGPRYELDHSAGATPALALCAAALRAMAD